MTQHNLSTYRAQTGGAWKALVDGSTTGGGTATKSMLIGANAADFDNFSSALASASPNKGLQIRRSYDLGSGAALTPSSFSASAAGGDPGRGVASYWSCSGETVSTVASGDSAALTRIQNFAASIPAGHKTFITYWHEADLKNKGGSFTVAQFQQAQTNVYNAIKNYCPDPANVFVAPLLTASGYGFNGNDAGTANWYPTDNTKYDFCGIDHYEFQRPSSARSGPGLPSPTTTYWIPPVDPSSNDYGAQHPPKYYCTSALNFATANGKKLVVGEHSVHPWPQHPSYYNASTGAIDTVSRPYRIQTTVDYHDANGTLAFMFFHANAGNRGPWWLDAFHQFSGSTGAVAGHPLSDINPDDHTTYPDPDTMSQIRNILSVRP